MISVAVITKNEERNIERCLRSVQWADEIILVDDFSSDATVRLAEGLRAVVIQKKWMGYAKQKEFAVQQTKNDWVLSLDADEEVTAELQKEIVDTLSLPCEFNGFNIPRKSYFLGKWIKHSGWYPGYQLRLFKKSKTRMNYRPVHEGFLTEGNVGTLQGGMNHYTYQSLSQYIEKMNDYTSLDVTNKLSDGRTIHWYNFIFNPLSLFLRMFFSLRGYRDGFHGFLLAYYSSVSELVLLAKCWEYQTAVKQHSAIPPVSSNEIDHLKQLSS
ncbi:MAG: glycosyltransferase family 2 protein [Bacteroidota bacterium]